MPSTAPRVICCPPELRPAALRRLHEQLPADQQSVLAQTLARLDPRDEKLWGGLLMAADSSRPAADAIDGIVWIQDIPGNTAVVWTPPRTDAVGEAVLKGAAAYIDERRIPLAQLVAGEDDGYSPALNRHCGFPKFANLSYLYAELAESADTSIIAEDDTRRSAGGLQFVPRAGDDPRRLSQVLEQTYIGTLDCPGLDGVRAMAEVLGGYRAQGRYSPGDWYFVVQDGVEIGALILAEHPGSGNWELVYMGVAPGARGQGIGEQIVRFARQQAARRGGERLVLAVDEANAHALAVYRESGFIQWDRRIVYARLGAGA
jgi:mycothiol synthase